MKKALTPIFLFFGILLSAQTSLSPGDIAFIGFNLDSPDDYTFILLKDVDASTTINFTDCGWVDGTSSFVCNSGDSNGWTWLSGSSLSLGQTVTITVPTLSASTGSVSGSSGVMSNLGDQIFAYQGTAGSPTFISGVHSDQSPVASDDANWSGNTTSNQTSALPNTLTTGTTANRLHNGGAEVDNWQYNCAVTNGDVAMIRNAVNNPANWINDNTNGFSPIDPGCTWSITPLPVELISFEVKPDDHRKAKISWITATETNNDFFTIEKSKDARNWGEVAIVNGSGNSFSNMHYQIYDEHVYSGLSYYRLKQTDFDGQSDYSEIVSLTFDLFNETKGQVYPNPAKGVITFEGRQSAKDDFVVLNALGQDVSNQVKVLSSDNLQFSLDISALPVGGYSFVVWSEVYKIYKH